MKNNPECMPFPIMYLTYAVSHLYTVMSFTTFYRHKICSISVPIVGFSWESNTTWANAKQIANENGPELAHFIFDYKNTCKHQHNKDVNVRLVAHSLGARVVLSTLEGLNNIAAWNTNHFNPRYI